MALSREEIVTAVLNLCEDRIKSFTLESWLDVELAKIINRKRYWWRKKILNTTLTAGNRELDLTAGSPPPANDFQEMIRLFRWDSETSRPEIDYVSEAEAVLAMQHGTKTGPPTGWTIKPGTTQTLLFYPQPTADATIRGTYWAALNPSLNQATGAVPLLPPGFHHVALLALQKRAFQYLYGQKDPRFMVAVAELKEGVDELDSFRGPASAEAVEFRSQDSDSFVQSTR